MKICQCENGHFFDSEVNAECPYCEGKITPGGFTPAYPHSRQGAAGVPPVCIYAGPPPGEWSKPDTGRNKGAAKETLLDRLKKRFR